MTYEKRRRRRESHNAVERRRRDNINDRIQELFTLLPESMIDAQTKPNKGMILKKSVEYIRQLRHALQTQTDRLHELETGIPSSMAAAAAAAGIGQPHQPQTSSGLAAMFAGAASMPSSRTQGGDGSMMNNNGL
ncbi:helix-loop-helix DNA-binding domain-containing protein [Coemansia spiralis]|nr:helix-loop-helix DNA-binding domain-containing protein [Coemansia spiralis]